MRRTRTFLILALALVCGLLAAWAVMRLLEQQATPVLAAPVPSARQVVVAARPLGIGELLSEQDVKLVNWPGNAVPEGYASSVSDVVGRGVITQVALNEALLDSKLADRGQGGLQITIPEGMRAISVRVDEVIGVAGFVTVGTRVDVYLTVEQEGSGSSEDRGVTKLIMQNVQALALNQSPQRDPEGNPVVATVITVLVSPDDAEKLIHAASRGRIQMALRNLIDVKDVTTDGARVSELLTGVSGGRRTARSASAPAAPQPSGTAVEVIKGGQRALIRF